MDYTHYPLCPPRVKPTKDICMESILKLISTQQRIRVESIQTSSQSFTSDLWNLRYVASQRPWRKSYHDNLMEKRH